MEWPKTSEEEWRRSDVSGLELDGYLENGNSGAGTAGSLTERKTPEKMAAASRQLEREDRLFAQESRYTAI